MGVVDAVAGAVALEGPSATPPRRATLRVDWRRTEFDQQVRRRVDGQLIKEPVLTGLQHLPGRLALRHEPAMLGAPVNVGVLGPLESGDLAGGVGEPLVETIQGLFVLADDRPDGRSGCPGAWRDGQTRPRPPGLRGVEQETLLFRIAFEFDVATAGGGQLPGPAGRPGASKQRRRMDYPRAQCRCREVLVLGEHRGAGPYAQPWIRGRGDNIRHVGALFC